MVNGRSWLSPEDHIDTTHSEVLPGRQDLQLRSPARQTGRTGNLAIEFRPVVACLFAATSSRISEEIFLHSGSLSCEPKIAADMVCSWVVARRCTVRREILLQFSDPFRFRGMIGCPEGKSLCQVRGNGRRLRLGYWPACVSRTTGNRGNSFPRYTHPHCWNSASSADCSRRMRTMSFKPSSSRPVETLEHLNFIPTAVGFEVGCRRSRCAPSGDCVIASWPVPCNTWIRPVWRTFRLNSGRWWRRSMHRSSVLPARKFGRTFPGMCGMHSLRSGFPVSERRTWLSAWDDQLAGSTKRSSMCCSG